MNIKNPEFLILYTLIPVLIFFLYYSYKTSKKNLLKFCSLEKLKEIIPSFNKKFLITKFTILSLSLLFIITAIISPRWGYDWKEVERKGANIFIALDLSKSMLADDISPSRLFRAKLEIEKLINILDGDRVGFIIFAGSSYLQSPLTHDYIMVKNWIQEIDTEAIQNPGTSIKSAIETAIKGFSHVDIGSKILILISDGEEQDEKTKEMAQEAKKQGIKIVSIGVGSSKGAPIKYNGSLIKDEKGKIVISRLNDSMLKEIASLTDGKYIRSRSGDFHLEQLYRNFIRGENESVKLKSGKIQKWKESFQIFLGVAFILMVIEIFLGINFKNFFSSLILISLLVNSSPSHAFFNINKLKANNELKNNEFSKAKENYIKELAKNPKDSRLNYHLGVCLYKENNLDQAQNFFNQSISNNPKDNFLKEKSFYNLGNTLFKKQEYKNAIFNYEQALKIDPEDKKAEFNLKLAKKLLEEQNEKQENNEDKENQDQNKENKDKKDKDQKQKQDQKNKDKEEQEKNKDKLSKQELENLLMQIKENKLPKNPEQQAQQENNNSKKLKPW
ncbi:MAG: VWA domain-containing protein [Candidatus Caenarcaniphilales bacterium]|nr:VWA domain-containing protein [Candidatus Caenarcaniphilales bacterium]